MEEKEKFLIIDGNSIMNRTFYAIRNLTTKDGLHTNALYGFLNIYYMMLEKLNPDYVAVSFDLSAPTFRHKLYGEYKAGRRSMPDELRMQMPIIKDILNAMTVPIIEIEGYEADDVLSTVAKKNDNNGIETYILTGDRDSFQIISELSHVVIPTSKMGKTEYTIYNPELLKEKYDIYPNQVVDVKSLMGDSSDNIPGVPGIGEKTAYSLISKYNNLDYIYENIDNIDIKDGVKNKLKENKEIALLSRKLATICMEVPIELDYSKLKLTDVNIDEITNIFTRLQFKKFLDRYGVKGLDSNITTKAFEEFNESAFYEIKDLEKLSSILNNSIVFIYLDVNCKVDILKNKVYFLIDNAVYYFSSERLDLLNIFASVDIQKIGFNIKKFLKHIIDNKINDIIGFNNDVTIEYYLLHPDTSNFSIENIAYNELSINMPELIFENVATQTSIFDAEIVKEKIEISIENKKYIYAFLQSIKNINNKLIPALEENGLTPLYKDVEIPLIRTLADMESVGMYVDKNRLADFGVYLDKEIAVLQEEIYKLAGEDFNINSPSQLGIILYEKLSLHCPKKTKTSYSTDKETLLEIINENEIVGKVLEYRTLSKLKSTYVEGLIPLIDNTGRIHTTFMQTVTATGRLSSVEPNLQNIPIRTALGGKIRECFIAEKDNIIVDADYSQIELRILAHISSDNKMINSFINGEDIHTATAAEVFDIPKDEVTKEERSKAKAVNFGIVYGISDYGLSKNIASSRIEAKKYIDNYLAKYNKIDEYMKLTVEDAIKNGYVTTMYGRKRAVPELKSANHNTIMFGKRIAMNMPIQGTAADIMKMAMNSVYYKLLQDNMKSKLIMQVHDEILVETAIDEVDKVKEILKESMENVVKLRVPLIADINEGKSWYDAK